MDTIYVGTSELPGRTFGKPQIMELGAGLQVIGLLAKRTALGLSRITVNEGIRSRPDQDLCWADYQNGTGPRAAWPYTSIHDPSRGGAVDFGGAGGAVLTDEEHAWLVANGPAYGVTWTGAGFGEWWHFEAVRAGARIIVPAQTTAPAGTGGTTPIDSENDLPKEDTMTTLLAAPKGQGALFEGVGYVDVTSDDVRALQKNPHDVVRTVNVTNGLLDRIKLRSALNRDERILLLIPSAGYALLENRKVTPIGSGETLKVLQTAGVATVTITAAQLTAIAKDMSK
jgi:hypothetical protein